MTLIKRLDPAEVVAQFRDYGLPCELQDGFPFCPVVDRVTMRLVLKACAGMGLGARLFAEGAAILPTPGASMAVRAGETVVGKIHRI